MFIQLLHMWTCDSYRHINGNKAIEFYGLEREVGNQMEAF